MALPPSVVTVADAVSYFQGRDASREARLAALEAAGGVPELGEIALSGNLVNTVASSGSIIGRTAGSTFSSNISGMSINSAAGTYSFTGVAAAGTAYTITETLNGVSRATQFVVSAANVVVLEPNPVPTATAIDGPINKLDLMDAGNGRHYIEATVTAGTTIELYFAGFAEGNAAGFRLLAGDHFQGGSRATNGDWVEGNPSYVLLPAEVPSYTNYPTVVHAELGTDGYRRLIVDGVVVFEQDLSQFIGGGGFGNFVGLGGSSNVVFTDIRYGVIGAGQPLRIASQQFAADYTPQARLAYSGSPSGYQVRIRSAGGTVLRDWADGLITNAIKGACTVTAAASVPQSEFGLFVLIDYRQKNDTTIVQTQSIQMPAGKAKIGMNLTPGGPNESVRVFKNLLQGNDGWRDGQATINPQNNPALFNARGDLISKGSFSPSMSFGRGTTPGTRFCVTWEGGKDPINDVRLNGTGQNVGYSNVVTSARRIEFDYSFDWATPGFGRIEQVNAYADTPVTNLWVTEVTTVRNGTYFDDDYIANNVAVYDYVRLMDCMGSNAANFIAENEPWLSEWDPVQHRTLPHQLTFGYTGYPIEFVIELANRANVDIWIMHPAGSSPDRQKKLIRALFYGELMDGGLKLNSNINVFDELGNEWFNSQFSIWHSAVAAARANGRGQPGNNESRIAEMAYRHKAHWAAIAGQFPAGRLKKLVMGNPADTYDGNVMSAFGADDYDIYGSAYYIMNVKFEDQPNLWPGQNLQGLFDFAHASIVTGLATLKNNRDFAASKGKGFWVYEGQQHWVEPNQTQPYADQAFYTLFQQDARMEGLMTAWFDSFTANFDGGLTCYQAFGAPSARYGAWGFTNDQADTTLVKSPKQRALLSAVQRLAA